MSRDNSRKNRSHGRNIDQDEAQLWAEITNAVDPLDDEQKKIVLKPARSDGKPGAEAAHPRHSSASRPGAADMPGPAQDGNKSAGRLSDEPFDRRNMRKIGSGQISIDDRIDLHGMRQSEAFQTLKNFLIDAQAAHCRTVLVITGKRNRRAQARGAELAQLARSSGCGARLFDIACAAWRRGCALRQIAARAGLTRILLGPVDKIRERSATGQRLSQGRRYAAVHKPRRW